MADKLENPYEKFGAHPCEVKLGHGWCWLVTFLFVLICSLAPFWRNIHQASLGPTGWTPVIEIFQYSDIGGETLYEHLRRAEKRTEGADFTGPPRRALQRVKTAVFREGNRKTIIGRDGWLYFRPAIDALTGYGPLEAEPETVAKDPTREPWRGPLEAILHFERQLEEFGVELILVPIPVKPMIYPEHLTGRYTEGPITHPDAESFYEKLRQGGVDVLDLTQPVFEMKGMIKEGELFLKQDTHWTPEGMRQFSLLVADHLRQKPWFGELPSTETDGLPGTRAVSALGDLVVNLEFDESGLFEKETAGIRQVKDSDVFDEESPIVLLGDSFTNIYHQKDMNWGEHAGFAQHLSRELGVSLDTIARNGQASTGVRRSLAVRPYAEQMMREKKKAVVWAIAARDLFLSETAGKELVEWKDVTFNRIDPAEGVDWKKPVVIEAKVSFVSPIPDPASVAYRDCLYAIDYSDVKVVEGTYPLEAAQVYHWAFRNKQMLPSAYYQVKDRHRLVLTSFADRKELQSLQARNDSPEIGTLPPAWPVGKVIPLEGGGGDSRSQQAAARIASIATVVFALLLGGVILVVFRKKSATRAGMNREG